MWQAMRKRLGARDGFTLIELVVVVAILGLLALIVTPKVVDAISNARTNSFKSSAKQIQVGMERIYAEKGAYPTGAAMCGDAWKAAADACTTTKVIEALANYVNLDANIISSAKYDPAGYQLTILFTDGNSNTKTATITPSAVALSN